MFGLEFVCVESVCSNGRIADNENINKHFGLVGSVHLLFDLVFKGGGRAADAAQKITEEHPARYPAPYFVFESTFPAYAFYLRHADGMRFENVNMHVMDADEARPPIIADDAIYETLP